MYVHVHVCVLGEFSVYVCMYVCLFVYIFEGFSVCVCMYVCLFICVYVLGEFDVYVCMLCVCMYMYIHCILGGFNVLASGRLAGEFSTLQH